MALVQLGLGIATILSGVDIALASAHQAGAVLLLTTLLVVRHRATASPSAPLSAIIGGMTGKPAWRFLRPALLVGLPLVAVTATVMPSAYAQSPPLSTPGRATPPAPPPRPSETTIRLAPPPSACLRLRPPLCRRRRRSRLPPSRPGHRPNGWPCRSTTCAASPMPATCARWRSWRAGWCPASGCRSDSQSAAGWLLRAAEAGSPAAAFNVGVMYERGFVVERDSAKAVEWYQKAADGNVAVAKHNLALLLRDGKGAPRDGKRAIELLRSAARQGMTASMFFLGDIYERGDAASRDAAMALAWFAVAVEFERQVNHAPETSLAKTAQQRVETLHRALTPAELERAEKIGQVEFQHILAALAPPKSESPPGAPSRQPPNSRCRRRRPAREPHHRPTTIRPLAGPRRRSNASGRSSRC